MPLAGFELAIPARDWPQTHALERAATGIGHCAAVEPGTFRFVAQCLDQLLHCSALSEYISGNSVGENVIPAMIEQRLDIRFQAGATKFSRLQKFQTGSATHKSPVRCLLLAVYWR